MSPAHVLEPTFAAIKHKLLAGAWPMGARLEATRIAEDLGVSITPVRDSLNRLAGETLVELNPGDGFHVARFGEQAFRDLLELQLTLLSAALVASPREPLPTIAHDGTVDMADRAGALFDRIARRAGNAALTHYLRNIGERLHPARVRDELALDEVAAELAALEQALAGPALGDAVRARLTRYHDRRAREAARYIALLEHRSL